VTRGWPELTLGRLEHNRGLAEACNRGVAAGSEEIMALLNNDVDCDPRFLQALVVPLHADPVAALTVQPGEPLIDSIGVGVNVTLAPEAVVVLGDLAISWGLAVRGRIAGSRAAEGLPRLARRPADAVDATASGHESFTLRRGVHGRRSA
jgi:hypothetical protein